MITSIDAKSTKSKDLYRYLSDAITPRPIAFVSSIDKEGNKNLSPFSFFNVFSIDPPVLVFSPVKRTRDNTNKDTLENVKEINECVISLVTEEIAQQVSLASSEFDSNINEFKKAGLTEVKSECIAPSRVMESPINFECKVTQIIALGSNGGAGNLVICEVLKIHIDNRVLENDQTINPFKLNIVSRYGKNWYGKTTTDSLYEIAKPISKTGIGIDQLPDSIKESTILTGNDLAILASIEKIPEKKDFTLRGENNTTEKHILAKAFLEQNETEKAWQILL
tara:strand:- start:10 stop:849 length:840 start_codon:yes stop_codon:yes gene_type:complete